MNKTQATSIFSKTLKSYRTGTILPEGPDKQNIIRICQLSPKYNKKASRENLEVRVGFFTTSSGKKTKVFFLHENDKTVPVFKKKLLDTAFPVKHRKKRAPSPEAKYKTAYLIMRYLIQPQIDKFRSDWRVQIEQAKWKQDTETLNQLRTCPLSGENLYEIGNHVDHIKPFLELAHEWAKTQNIDLSNIETVGTGTTKVFKNQDLNDSWVAYHAENATLRIVTAEANLKRKKPQRPL